MSAEFLRVMKPTMSFEDHFSAQATGYALYRPTYPRSLFDFLASLVDSHELAWDCATGNGQAALGLADRFDCVIASDASAEQIANAFVRPRITYRVFSAEHPELADRSVDLITVAQALHWFDLDAFYSQAKRVLKPSGVIAAWCYQRCRTSTELDDVLDRLNFEVLKPYWPERVQYVNEHYRTIPFPFEELNAPEIAGETSWTLDQLIGYLSSWSAVQAFVREQGRNPLEDVLRELSAAWGPQPTRTFRWPFYLRVGRQTS